MWHQLTPTKSLCEAGLPWTSRSRRGQATPLHQSVCRLVATLFVEAEHVGLEACWQREGGRDGQACGVGRHHDASGQAALSRRTFHATHRDRGVEAVRGEEPAVVAKLADALQVTKARHGQAWRGGFPRERDGGRPGRR